MMHIAFQETIIPINKPLHWSSFEVVKKLKSLLKINKIGHAGTLDPLASGLLIICTGNKTKHICYYQDLLKTYQGSILLGKTTASFDLETPFENIQDYKHLKEEQIHDTTKNFLGDVQQIPPHYSAVKVNGKRAYQKIRAGDQFELKPKTVLIKKFEIDKIELPYVYFKVECSKGTYIRSLANDFGKQLGVGGCLSSLQRSAIGDFKSEYAFSIEDFEKIEYTKRK